MRTAKVIAICSYVITAICAGLPCLAAHYQFDLKECETYFLAPMERGAAPLSEWDNVPDAASVTLSASPTLFEAFERTFRTSLYAPEVCGANVQAFLLFAQNRGIAITDTKVLVLSHANRKPIVTRTARNLLEQRWDYHVVMMKDGLILDFDFGTRPRPTEAREYFERMFSDPTIQVTEIPADDFTALKKPEAAPGAYPKYPLGIFLNTRS